MIMAQVVNFSSKEIESNHMKKKYYLYILAFIAIFYYPLKAQDNKSNAPNSILVNGGFELGEPSDFGKLSGWDVFGNVGAIPVGFTKTKIGFFPTYSPIEGKRMAIFSAGNNDFGGFLSQTMNTEPGFTYFIKLKIGVATEATGRCQAVQISVSDGSGASILSSIEKIYSIGSGTTWKEYTAKFLAAGKITNLKIFDMSEILPAKDTTNTDLILDDAIIKKLAVSKQ